MKLVQKLLHHSRYVLYLTSGNRHDERIIGLLIQTQLGQLVLLVKDNVKVANVFNEIAVRDLSLFPI